MSRKALSVQVYEKVKDGIISLKYPPEYVLKEREISESMGVSRTPVREAIQRLAQEAWLVPGEGKRMQVRPITGKDVQEIIQIRNLVEYAAIDEVLKKGESRVVAGKLDLILNEMKSATEVHTLSMLDLQFHYCLVESMNNERLLKFWSTVQDEVMRMGLLMLKKRERWKEVICEHEYLVEMLWNRDSEKAHFAMKLHLENSYATLLSKIN